MQGNKAFVPNMDARDVQNRVEKKEFGDWMVVEHR